MHERRVDGARGFALQHPAQRLRPMRADQRVCALAVAEDRAEERVMAVAREGADCAGIGLGHRRHGSWLRSGMPCRRHGARAGSSLAARSRRRNPEAAPVRRGGRCSVNLAGTASGRMPNKRGTRGNAGMGRNLRNSVPEMTRNGTRRLRPPVPAQPKGPNRGVATRFGTWRGRNEAAPTSHQYNEVVRRASGGKAGFAKTNA